MYITQLFHVIFEKKKIRIKKHRTTPKIDSEGQEKRAKNDF